MNRREFGLTGLKAVALVCLPLNKLLTEPLPKFEIGQLVQDWFFAGRAPYNQGQRITTRKLYKGAWYYDYTGPQCCASNVPESRFITLPKFEVGQQIRDKYWVIHPVNVRITARKFIHGLQPEHPEFRLDWVYDYKGEGAVGVVVPESHLEVA